MAQSKPGDTINYSMSQDYLPVENSAVNKDFGLEFPGNQYDFEAQHQTASDDGSAQWTSDSGITVFLDTETTTFSINIAPPEGLNKHLSNW
jgi:hypothetical protein